MVVDNAGRGLLGAVEEADGSEVRAVYETNVFGLLAVVRAATPFQRGPLLVGEDYRLKLRPPDVLRHRQTCRQSPADDE